MEVRAENIGDSKFRVQPFSSAKAVSIMETANEGTTIKFAAKTASLDEDWKVAFATKKGDHFEVFFEENTEEKHIF